MPPILLPTIIHNFIFRKGERQEEYRCNRRFAKAVVLIWDVVFQIAVPFFREVVTTVPQLTLSESQKQSSSNLPMLTFTYKRWRNPQLNQITIASCLLQKQEAPGRDKSGTTEVRTVSGRIWCYCFPSSLNNSCFEDNHARKVSIRSPPIRPFGKLKIRTKHAIHATFPSILCNRSKIYLICSLTWIARQK